MHRDRVVCARVIVIFSQLNRENVFLPVPFPLMNFVYGNVGVPF